MFFWHQSEARTAAIVWNWSGKTLSPGALLAVLYFSSFHIYFSARLYFPSSPLSAPGSPRMVRRHCSTQCFAYNHGQKSLGQSQRSFNSMCFTTSVAKSSAVILQMHVPSPSPPNAMLKDQRNCALTVSTLSVGWREGVGTYSVSSARIKFRVC